MTLLCKNKCVLQIILRSITRKVKSLTKLKTNPKKTVTDDKQWNECVTESNPAFHSK